MTARHISIRQLKTPEDIKLFESEMVKLSAMKLAKDKLAIGILPRPENMNFRVMWRCKQYGTARTVEGAIRIAEAARACIREMTKG